MKKLILALLALGIVTTACTAETAKPIPQSGKVTDTTAATVPVPAAPATPATSPAKVPVTAPVKAAKTTSTCDDVREALLTGTQAQINAALAALKADTTADGTAREYADYYLNRDRTQPSLREMDVSLIRMSCS